MPRWRALVLAAGLGTRLRPLTDELPKPLLPVLGRSLLARSLDALAAAGCEAAAVNLHHRGDAIVAAIGERWAGMPVTYSHEDPILGTGGALVPLREFFAGCSTVVVLNGDSLCDWPLRELLARHRRAAAEATLLVAGRPDPREFGGGLGLDRRGRVTALRREPTYGPVAARRVFAGAAALAPALLDRLPPGPSDSMERLYRPLLEERRPVAALVTWRPWHDLGTPGRYLDAALDLARRTRAAPRASESREKGAGSGSSRRAIWVSADAWVRDARLSRCVVEAGAAVAPGAELARCALLPGAMVGEGARLSRAVVGPAAAVPAGSAWDGVLLTRWRAGGTTPDGSRREGALLVTPLRR